MLGETEVRNLSEPGSLLSTELHHLNYGAGFDCA